MYPHPGGQGQMPAHWQPPASQQPANGAYPPPPSHMNTTLPPPPPQEPRPDMAAHQHPQYQQQYRLPGPNEWTRAPPPQDPYRQQGPPPPQYVQQHHQPPAPASALPLPAAIADAASHPLGTLLDRPSRNSAILYRTASSSGLPTERLPLRPQPHILLSTLASAHHSRVRLCALLPPQQNGALQPNPPRSDGRTPPPPTSQPASRPGMRINDLVSDNGNGRSSTDSDMLNMLNRRPM
ncbi:hypothetical protein N0V86_003587 [Didymella sp. IMI 355093]|nr:hypothetical protein N0V86_003587 [Didymella sp. IMI 355093]